MIIVVSLFPMTLRAETALQLTVTINNFKGGGTGLLIATANGNTVLVNGTLTGVTSTLFLTIDAGVTILWQAAISTSNGVQNSQLINLSGGGTFNVASGGSITVTSNATSAIFVASGALLTVNGTGKIQTTGENCWSIRALGNVEVNGGEVTSAGMYGKVIQAYENSSITVSGTGKVQATGMYGQAIVTYGNLKVSGGEVSSVSNATIWSLGDNSTITISDTGKVRVAEGSGNSVIFIVAGNLEIKGGEVIADWGSAITDQGDKTKITVSGGLVFGLNNAISGSLYSLISSDNFTGVTGTGVVIAWNQGKGNTSYTKGSFTDILQLPESAKVQWDTNGLDHGISYTSGTNKGFIPLNVIVNSPSVIPDETKPVGLDGKGSIALNLSIPNDATLTGSFEIQFPEGMTLDEELTVLSLELSDNFYLSFTKKENNIWFIEIKSNSMRSSKSSEYQKIMDIAYNVDESLPSREYEATIMNLDFLLDDDMAIKEDLVTVPINVERYGTSIASVNNSSFYAYCTNSMLRIESAKPETITIFTATGAKLYSAKKNAGSIYIPVSSLPWSVYIIKGSISGTIKVVR